MYIGIDIGGTNLVAGLVDREGSLEHKASCPVDRSWTPEELVHQLAQLSLRAAREGNCPLGELEGVGAGFPGLVDSPAGVVVKTTNMPFRNTPFRALFQRELDLPVYLGNDADCAAAGEYWAGAAKGYDPVLMITLGTGIGGGLVKGGKLYTGFGGAGLEAGHMLTHPGGEPCGCGNRGCWERYGSATALIQQTRAAMEAHRDSSLWEVCGGDLAKVRQPQPFPDTVQQPATGFEDDFKTSELKPDWTWNYPYAETEVRQEGGKLYLTGTPKEGCKQGTALCVRAQTPDYNCETQVANQGNSLKGLTLYGDDGNLLAWGVSGSKLQLKVVKDGKDTVMYQTECPYRHVRLRFSLKEGTQLDFSYSEDGKEWHAVNRQSFNAKDLLRWDRVQRPGLIHIGSKDDPAVFDWFRMRNR